MVTISKPLSAGQAQAYHTKEFTNAEQAYYNQHGQVRGEWHGALAAQWGLAGQVAEEQFTRLANGQHPLTGEQMVRQREPFQYLNQNGDAVKSMEHRAGWDATFSAPKSVSLTALVGGDERVRQAHNESVVTALNEMERFAQARMGGNHPAVTTGKWATATFQHDSARPVNGYSAPQLHTHALIFNVTETPDGKTRAMQPRELYKSQKYATAVYQSELAYRLKQLGYETEAGKNGAPEIKGYTPEYLQASSPRSQQIKTHLEEQGFRGPAAAEIAAHRTRDAKSPLTAEEMLAKHRELSATFGNQPERVVQEARERQLDAQRRPDESRARANEAMTYSRDRHFEREAVVGERDLMRDALRRAMGEATFQSVRADFDERLRSGEFVQVNQQRAGAGKAFTTREMLDYERDNISLMKEGQERYRPLASQHNRETPGTSARLSENQRHAVDDILGSRDQVVGLQGGAGTGKTASLAAIREAAEAEGFKVEGFAPTSRAAQQLAEAGIDSKALQRHLARPHAQNSGEPHLYILDESSLASTKQVNDFLHRLQEGDRALLVGDTRQHQGVEAGRPFQQFQEAGMHTAHLDEIIRQRDHALRNVVDLFARGQIQEALANLQQQGRVHEIPNQHARMDAIAKAYAEHPEQTLVVSPDNKSRQQINERIHSALQASGKVDEKEHRLPVLVPRQDLTGADRRWAAQYDVGDVLRYSRGSGVLGIDPGEYARVTQIDREHNLLTVQREDGQLTYDPRRLHGVNVYKEDERGFSKGDRIQLTAPYAQEGIPNRQLGTIDQIDADGNLRIKFDSDRDVAFNIREHPHVDHGYAMTSHSSQGLTADRVLMNIDTDQAHENLINARLGYVGASRGRDDLQLYTNDAESLARELSKDVSKGSALDAERNVAQDCDRVPCDEGSRAADDSPRQQVEREQTEQLSSDRGDS